MHFQFLGVATNVSQVQCHFPLLHIHMGRFEQLWTHVHSFVCAEKVIVVCNEYGTDMWTHHTHVHNNWY